MAESKEMVIILTGASRGRRTPNAVISDMQSPRAFPTNIAPDLAKLPFFQTHPMLYSILEPHAISFYTTSYVIPLGFQLDTNT